MNTELRDVSEIFHYHAHVYFNDAASRDLALRLREEIGQRFAVEVGRVFEQPVGPHPCPQYEIGFLPDALDDLLPWLLLNRQGLSVLIHPNTDREYDDHFAGAMWLGQPLALLGEPLAHSLKAVGQDAPRAVQINHCQIPIHRHEN